MGWLATIGSLIQLIALLVSKWFEKDEARKKLKGEAAKQVTTGIQTRDRSQITAGFAKLKSL